MRPSPSSPTPLLATTFLALAGCGTTTAPSTDAAAPPPTAAVAAPALPATAAPCPDAPTPAFQGETTWRDDDERLCLPAGGRVHPHHLGDGVLLLASELIIVGTTDGEWPPLTTAIPLAGARAPTRFEDDAIFVFGLTVPDGRFQRADPAALGRLEPEWDNGDHEGMGFDDEAWDIFLGAAPAPEGEPALPPFDLPPGVTVEALQLVPDDDHDIAIGKRVLPDGRDEVSVYDRSDRRLLGRFAPGTAARPRVGVTTLDVGFIVTLYPRADDDSLLAPQRLVRRDGTLIAVVGAPDADSSGPVGGPDYLVFGLREGITLHDLATGAERARLAIPCPTSGCAADDIVDLVRIDNHHVLAKRSYDTETLVALVDLEGPRVLMQRTLPDCPGSR